MELQASTEMSGLAWKWILEKLLDLPDFGVTFINEVITTHVSDIEEPYCRPLLERVALRNLQEMVSMDQLNLDAIPLLKALTIQDFVPLVKGFSVKQRFNKELVLRVQTEVVLSALRKDMAEGEIDWVRYASELESVFAEETDSRVLTRKRELSALLKNQTNYTIVTYLEKHPLNKLKKDLNMFLDERRATFKAMFLDQLSRDFLASNGTPFLEARCVMDKSEELNSRAKQVHKTLNTANVLSFQTNQDIDLPRVGHETGSAYDMTETGGQNIVLGTAAVSGKKRPRRKLLPTRDNSDDVFQELEDCIVANNQLRTPTSISLGVPSKEGMLLPRSFGSDVMRIHSPHLSVSVEGVTLLPRESSLTNKYVTISGVESDADTQVVDELNIDNEKCAGGVNRKEGAQSASRSEALHSPSVSPRNIAMSGSDRGYLQKIVATEVVRTKTIVLPSERKMLELGIEGAFTCSSDSKIAERPDIENFVIKNESVPLDGDDTYEVDFHDIGDYGQEEICHKCGLDGDLTCCDGCPISMHLQCIEALSFTVPKSNEDWYCPICVAVKASQEATEARKAAAVAREKLKAFIKESKKSRNFSEANLQHHSGQEKAVKRSDFSVFPPQPDDIDTTLKLQQHSDERLKLRYAEAQLDSDPRNVSSSPILSKSLNQSKQRGELESESTGLNLSPVGRTPRFNQKFSEVGSKSLVKCEPHSIQRGSAESVLLNQVVKKVERVQDTLDQNTSSRQPLAASASGRKRKKTNIYGRVAKRKGLNGDSDEAGLQQEAGVEEPRSGSGCCRDVDGDERDTDLDEDCNEHVERSRYSGYRQRDRKRRRSPLPWSRAEEDALKEGVRQFSHHGAWGFQWKRILQFGQGRFDPRRTDVDLKDKWRNLVKGVS